MQSLCWVALRLALYADWNGCSAQQGHAGCMPASRCMLQVHGSAAAFASTPNSRHPQHRVLESHHRGSR